MPRAVIALALLTATIAAAEPVRIPGPAANYAPETVVARIDGRPITFEDLMFRLAQLPDEARRGYDGRPDGLRLFLRDVVAKEELLVAARAAQVERDRDFERLLELRRAEVMLDLYARRTLLSSIDDAALRARYAAAGKRFDVTPLVRLRYLLVTPVKEATVPNESGDDAVGDEEARSKAERLRAEIVMNGNFAGVARRSSEDESSRAGGDLGWVDPATLVAEVGGVAMSLALGDVSPVVHSSLGYHVVQPIARRQGGVIPFEAVREVLLQEAVGEKRSELAAKARMERERLESEHKVELFPERLP